MFVDSRIVELTRSFYDWELQGRGWAIYPITVALEPPFKPFAGPRLRNEESLDDARRETWLSSLLQRFRGDLEEVSNARAEGPFRDPDPTPSGTAEMEELVIALPQDTRVPQEALLSWLRSLATSSGPVSFELLCGDAQVQTRLAMTTADASHVIGQIQAALPAAVVLPAPDTLEQRWAAIGGQRFAAIEFGLASEFMVPLASFSQGDEPLLPVIAALADVAPGELGLLQVLFEETHEP